MCNNVQEFEQMRVSMEPLFQQAGVDVVFYGHGEMMPLLLMPSFSSLLCNNTEQKIALQVAWLMFVAENGSNLGINLINDHLSCTCQFWPKGSSQSTLHISVSALRNEVLSTIDETCAHTAFVCSARIRALIPGELRHQHPMQWDQTQVHAQSC